MLVMYLTMIDDPTDRELFTQLYTEHRYAMFCHANCILHDKDLSEDAVQNAFLTIIQNIKHYDFTKDSRNLLITIARNAALTMKNQRDREQLTFDNVGIHYAGSHYNLENQIDAIAKLSNVLEIVDSMPHTYAAVFRLKYINDLTYSQISDILGISVSAAKKRIQRTKEHIIKVLRGENDEI